MAVNAKLAWLSELLKICVKYIDEGKCNNLPDESIDHAIRIISSCVNPQNRYSKAKAASYLNMSQRQFDRYISYGIIPKGRHELGFKELSWSKEELDGSIAGVKNKSRKLDI